MGKVRTAAPSDMEALHRIAFAGGDAKAEGYFDRCFEEQEKSSREIFLIGDGAVAGYAMYQRQPRYQPFRSLHIPEIQDLRIDQSFQRRGYATALIEHCCALAIQEGHDLIGLGVGLYSDYGKAQRLYAKLGFEPDGGGIVYDRETVRPGQLCKVDDELCLMMIKRLK